MAIDTIRAAFPEWTTNIRGEEVPPNHESDYAPHKASEFEVRFGETPPERRVNVSAKPAKPAA